MLLLAVDPGGTTGFAWTTADDVEAVAADQLPPQEFCLWAHERAEAWGADLTLIVEKFTISQRTLKVSRGGSYDAIEVIGVLRYLSQRYCGRDLEVQQPAEAMNLFPDAWLKNRGWYRPGLPHGNDALRHLALGLAKRKLIRIGM